MSATTSCSPPPYSSIDTASLLTNCAINFKLRHKTVRHSKLTIVLSIVDNVA